jgi:hypothetical protein
MKSLKFILPGLLAVLMSSNVLAHSDIELTLQNNKIIIDPNDEAELVGGYKLFEAEFGEFGNPYGTDDPGFDGFSLVGASLIWYQVENTLKKWDVASSSWLSSGFDEQIEIKKSPVTNIISATNGLNAQGFVGSVSSGGGLHTHVEFQIGKAGGGNPDDSAYLLELSLFDRFNNAALTPIGNASDKFFLAFHLNESGTFGHESFEQAIAAVPVPAAVWLFGSALTLLGFARRKVMAS